MKDNMKVNLGGVAETLLITLNVRGMDAMQNKPLLNDKKSLEIMESLDYDFSKFKNSKGTYFGTLARIRTMDREVKKFMEKYPNCNIVSIGCGLDTRFERIDNGGITWYNLDFPEVMELRKNFFEENPRVVNIAKSALDKEWTGEIRQNGEPILIISEGVFMYLKEEEIKAFLNIVTEAFESFELHLDLSHKFLVGKGRTHDTVKHTNAEFMFGVEDGSEIVDLNPKIKQKGLINFTDELSTFRLGWFRLVLPLLRKVNNRLGIYTFNM